MFYSTYVLTKDGPLAKIWLAAHWERRITRSDVKLMDLRKCVVDIVQPVVPIALRTSGELLVGVVRIYAVKVHSLRKDADSAVLLIRVAPTQTNVGQLKKAAAAVGQAAVTNGDVDAAPTNGGGRRTARPQAGIGLGRSHEEALEARFDDIADLLQGAGSGLSSVNNRVVSSADSSNIPALAWYTWTSASQGAEDSSSAQQALDGFAMLRADIRAFGDNGSETSSRKSSLPSIERGRASAITGAGGALGDFMPLPEPGYDLDIGAPLPDDGDAVLLPDFMPPEPGVSGAMDPFLSSLAAYNTDIEYEGPSAGQQQQQLLRRARAAMAGTANLLDKEDITVSGDEVQRLMENRDDIVEVMPRRGPFDTLEVQDRKTLAQDLSKGELWSVVGSDPLAAVVGPALRAAYIDALKPLVDQHVTAEAAERAARQQQQQRGRGAQAAEENPEEYIAAGGGDDLLFELDPMEAGRKRSRSEMEGEDDRNGAAGVGVNSVQSEAVAQATLRRVHALLSKAQGGGGAGAAGGKRGKKAIRENCTLQELCEGMTRREAARTFVSVLTLASKQLVWAKQIPDGVEIGVMRNAATESPTTA